MESNRIEISEQKTMKKPKKAMNYEKNLRKHTGNSIIMVVVEIFSFTLGILAMFFIYMIQLIRIERLLSKAGF